MPTTQEKIFAVIRSGARTPLDLVQELERDRFRDARRTLLRLIADGLLEFGIDGKIHIPRDKRGEPSPVTA